MGEIDLQKNLERILYGLAEGIATIDADGHYSLGNSAAAVILMRVVQPGRRARAQRRWRGACGASARWRPQLRGRSAACRRRYAGRFTCLTCEQREHQTRGV